MAKSFCLVKDLDKSFWGQNKEISYMSPFAAFIKEEESDKIMKAIYLIYDSKSSFRATPMSTEEIIKDVNINFLEEEDFPWADYEEYVEAYKEKFLSFTAKAVNNLRLEVAAIEEVIPDLSYADPDEGRQRMELTSHKKKLLEDLAELELKLENEDAEILLMGEYSPSLIESYGIES